MPDRPERPDRPDRPHANRGGSFETLFEAALVEGPRRGGNLPDALRRYGDRLGVALHPDRPTVIANFVESLDGVVSVDPEHGSGAEISGFSEPDRFLMGLLRSLADVVVLGAGTLRAAPTHAWTPAGVNRAYADAYAAWRRELGLTPEPTAIVVTASGAIGAAHPALHVEGTAPIIVTTAAGSKALGRGLPPTVRVRVVAGDHVSAGAVVETAAAEGARVVLCEGGPHLMGSFVEEGLLDELFLTVAPQLLGRPDGTRGAESGARLGLIEGIGMTIENAPWGRLRSMHRSGDHLFLRYAFRAD